MRVLAFSLLLALGLSSLKAQSEETVWKNYTSMEGLFQIAVPGTMQEKVDTFSTDIGQLIYHTFFYQNTGEDGTDNFVYMVSYVDYPEESVHSDSTELLREFFKATIEEAAFSINGDLIYQRPIQEDGYPGYLWRINYRDNIGMIKTKAFVKNQRYYAIQAVTLKELGLNRAIDKFLDSFQLLN